MILLSVYLFYALVSIAKLQVQVLYPPTEEIDTPTMGSKQFYDKNGIFTSLHLDGGHMRLTCNCPGRDIQVESESNPPVVYGTQSCFKELDRYFTFYINITHDTDFGLYNCRSGGIYSDDAVEIMYRICEQKNPRCRTKCSDKKPTFCLELEFKDPEGIPCSVPNFCAEERTHFSIPRFCPGNSDFCEAASNGLHKYTAEYMKHKCDVPEKTPEVRISGKAAHYLEAMVLDKRDTKYSINCPEGCVFRNWTTAVKIGANGKIVYEVNSGRCPLHYTLPYDKLAKVTPKSFRVVGVLQTHVHEWADSPNVPEGAAFRNEIVVFKEELVLTKRYDKDNAVESVEVELHDDPIDDFEIAIKATLNGKEIKPNGYIILIDEPGVLKVTFHQTYFSCMPHRQIEGPVLTKILTLMPNEFRERTFPATNSTSTSTTTIITTTDTISAKPTVTTTNTVEAAVESNFIQTIGDYFVQHKWLKYTVGAATVAVGVLILVITGLVLTKRRRASEISGST